MGLLKEALQKHQNQLLTVIDNVLSALMLPGPDLALNRQQDGSLAPRIHELRYCQEKLQARKVQIDSFLSDRRVELASTEIVKSYVDDLRNLLNQSSLPERRAFVRSFVKEVRVTGDYQWADASDEAIWQCINRMFSEIGNGKRNDWLRYNDALRSGCRKFRITSSVS